MNWSIACLLFGLIALVHSNPTNPTEQETLKASLDHFSSALYKKTVRESENAGKNLVMSPLSAQIALAMISMGAEGETLEQLQTSLQLPSKDFTKTAFKRAMSEFNDDNSVDHPQKLNEYGAPIYEPNPPVLRIVNKVFVKDGPNYVLSPDFKSMATDSFRSEIQNIDFAKKVDAAKTINSWVEDKTNKKIKNLVSPDSLDDQIRLMLVNAIYFKAAWRHPFDPHSTRKSTFSVNANKNVEVDFLNSVAFYKAVKLPEYDATALKLPFHGNDYSMVFIVPKKVDGLKAVEDQLASANLGDIVSRMHSNHLILSMPKFKIESTIDLKEILPKMGMAKMFSRTAELRGLLKNREALYVSDAKQKAFIEIDEYGCEAAAATQLSASPMSMPRPLTLNVPFYYAIIDGNGNKIFSGRLINPKTP